MPRRGGAFLYRLWKSGDNHQGCAGVHVGALGSQDLGNGAGLGGHDLVLHLHGFQDQQDLTLLDSLAFLNIDLQNGAGHGGGNGLTGSGGSPLNRRRSAGNLLAQFSCHVLT